MDNQSFKLLQTFSSRKTLTLTQLAAIYNQNQMNLAGPVIYLKNQDYLNVEQNYAQLESMKTDDPIGFDTPLVLSDKGKAAIDNEKKARKYHCLNEIRAWFTLLIAAAALAVSIVSLILQC